MKKSKTFYQCTTCTYQSIKWIGCCPECKTWDSFTETIQHNSSTPYSSRNATIEAVKPAMLTRLQDVPAQATHRLYSGIHEWDRVVGGGIMPGSLLILTGDPGIGKSTLLLQICNSLARQYRVFYFSTEESLYQVKQRAARLQCTAEHLFFSDQANLHTILATTHEHKPDLLIIDSIQNCYLSDTQHTPGGIGQLREATFLLMRLAKEEGITVLLTGHITKEGTIAGPKLLEHMVDGVFYLQGEDQWQTRVLRSVKNRFGTINELGFFEMESEGLREVPNINEHLIKQVCPAPGSVLVSAIEGTRPLLFELQALVIESKLSIPQRVISGVDHKQVVLIAAILEKYLQVRFSMHDIFFKVSGGFKTKSSTTDLGIAFALLSSYFQQPLPEKAVAIGEISLTGHIKPTQQLNAFIRESEKFGITQLYLATNQHLETTNTATHRFYNVYELLRVFTD